MSNTDPIEEEHIKVCVRIRPLLREEVLTLNEALAWTWEQNSITQSSSSLLKKYHSSNYKPDEHPTTTPSPYHFDFLFKPEDTNEDIFDSVVLNTVQQSMQGFHSSVFAYGQSGKLSQMFCSI
jgi:hypothetical protein